MTRPESPRDPVAWFLRQLAADPEAGRFGPHIAALIGQREQGICNCWTEEDSDPTDWEDTSIPLIHHCDCAAWVTAQFLAVAYVDRDGYDPEWAPHV